MHTSLIPFSFYPPLSASFRLYNVMLPVHLMFTCVYIRVYMHSLSPLLTYVYLHIFIAMDEIKPHTFWATLGNTQVCGHTQHIYMCVIYIYIVCVYIYTRICLSPYIYICNYICIWDIASPYIALEYITCIWITLHIICTTLHDIYIYIHMSPYT